MCLCCIVCVKENDHDELTTVCQWSSLQERPSPLIKHLRVQIELILSACRACDDIHILGEFS